MTVLVQTCFSLGVPVLEPCDNNPHSSSYSRFSAAGFALSALAGALIWPVGELFVQLLNFSAAGNLTALHGTRRQ